MLSNQNQEMASQLMQRVNTLEKFREELDSTDRDSLHQLIVYYSAMARQLNDAVDPKSQEQVESIQYYLEMLNNYLSEYVYCKRVTGDQMQAKISQKRKNAFESAASNLAAAVDNMKRNGLDITKMQGFVFYYNPLAEDQKSKKIIFQSSKIHETRNKILTQIMPDGNFEDLPYSQWQDLLSLSRALAEKAEEAYLLRKKGKTTQADKIEDDIKDCITETYKIVSNYIVVSKKLDTTRLQPLDLKDKKAVEARVGELTNIFKNDFLPNAKKFEKQAAQWTLGQKVFVGLGTLLGGLIGGLIGLIAGVGITMGGAAIGNIPGAVLGGAAGIQTFVGSMTFGATVGTGAAIGALTLLGLLTPVTISATSVFKTDQQKAVKSLRSKMEADLKADTELAVDETKIARDKSKLQTDKQSISSTSFLGKTRQGWKETAIEKKDTKLKQIQTNREKLQESRKHPKKT